MAAFALQHAGNYTQAQAMVTHQTAYSGTAVGIGGVGMRLACYANTGTQPYVCEIVPNSPAADSRQVSDSLHAQITFQLGASVVEQLQQVRGRLARALLTSRAWLHGY